ncbi:hypothetical protein RB595_004461 [Gaeumannomyces hyphopodioides]
MLLNHPRPVVLQAPMAWDSKMRNRGSSSASGAARGALPLHPKQAKQPTIQPDSAHVADPFLDDFLDPSSFDPVAYLNSVLPPLQFSTGAGGGSSSRSSATGRGRGSQHQQQPVSLAELSAQAQTQVSQLNAHTTRLANTLTQLTDEILRSGSRLAYEVELLRGETLGLAETLAEGLQDDIAKFVPGGVAVYQQQQQQQAHPKSSGGVSAGAEPQSSEGPPATAATATAGDAATGDDATAAAAAAPDADPQRPPEPPYIARLRTLTLVRARLDSVIKTFGEAMEFVFPPSEVSVSSSFLSVSAPDPGKEAHSTEEKGQQVLKKLRDEISALLAASDGQGHGSGSGSGAGDDAGADPAKGIEDAARRIEELKELNKVWRGTAEEKGRAKFVESLAKLVEDRHRDLLREMDAAKRDGAASSSAADGSASGAFKKSQAAGGDPPPAESRGYGGGYGFISQLQKIRSGL